MIYLGNPGIRPGISLMASGTDKEKKKADIWRTSMERLKLAKPMLIKVAQLVPRISQGAWATVVTTAPAVTAAILRTMKPPGDNLGIDTAKLVKLDSERLSDAVLAHSAYIGNTERLTKELKAHPERIQLILNRERSNVLARAFFIAISESQEGKPRRLYVVIRGSKSIDDWLTNFNCQSVSLVLPFVHDGEADSILEETLAALADTEKGNKLSTRIETATTIKSPGQCHLKKVETPNGHRAHDGMVKAAQELLEAQEHILWTLIEEHSKHKNGLSIRVIGHSLGGGVAAVLCALVDNKLQSKKLEDKVSLSCTTFGCPPVVDESLSKKLRKRVLSIVNASDVVPHLSPHLAHKLSDLSIFFKKKEEKSKKTREREQKREKESERDTLKARRACPRDKGPELRVPGRVLYMRKEGGVVDVTGSWRPYIQLTPSMVSDHLMPSYIEKIKIDLADKIS
ncbi:hypothetical protein AAMO2058_000560000 [Amorphochlora amoebiformis]